MTSNSYIKKLEVMENEETERQLSVGIPDEFATQYSFKEGEYVIASPAKDGILLKKIKNPEKIMLNFQHKTSKGELIDFPSVRLKGFDFPYDMDLPLPAKYKHKE